MRQTEGRRIGDRFLWRSSGAVTVLGFSISDCAVTAEPSQLGLKFKHPFHELTEVDDKRKKRTPLCSSSNDRQVLCRIWHVNQFLFGPFQQIKVQTTNSNTSSHNVLANHWGQKKNCGCAASGKGLKLAEPNADCREIILPVSVVVNGSHCSPTLTVDGKCRYGS